MLDRYELWSRRRFSRWLPEADLGLLIAPPFSTAVQAAHRLRKEGIPYVVDAGDPWAVTGKHLNVTGVARRRAKRLETRLWHHAAGGIVTTRQQADMLKKSFPELPILVRPNGYWPMEHPVAVPTQPKPSDELHLAHFGNVYAIRVGLVAFFRGLIESGRWTSITMHQYGQDWDDLLSQLPRDVTVCVREPVAWDRAVEISSPANAALVIGNKGGVQLPSKVIQYSTLPIPRIAVVEDSDNDCIADYVRGQPGWLVVTPSQKSLADEIAALVSREWTQEELAPPARDAWPAAAAQVQAFLADRLAGH